MSEPALKGKLESAWAKVIAALVGVELLQVCKGADTAELTRDRVVIVAQRGPEEPMGSGNRRMLVKVMVVSAADSIDDSDDPLARHNANCGAVFEGLETMRLADFRADSTVVTMDSDLFTVDQELRADLAELLTAQEDNFYCFSPVIDEGEDPDIEGRGWTEARMFTCYCCNCAIG